MFQNQIFPSRLGSEGSGIIDLIGNNNIKFKVGDEVTIIPFLSWDIHGNWTSDSSNKYGTYGRYSYCTSLDYF